MDDRRYYGLDALRGSMMMLGIVVHAASLYLADPPPHLPYIGDPNRSYLMDVLVRFIHSFRMPLFFVLAGFFASLLVDKRGLWGTYRNRVARILGPLLAGMFTVLPLSLLFMLDFALSVEFGTRDLIPNREDFARFERNAAAAGVPRDLFLGHLWFLYYLCYFYLLLPLCRGMAKASRRFEATLKPLLVSPFALAGFALFTAATLWPYPGAEVFGNFLFLTPHPPTLLYYGSFFVFGYLLHAHRGFLQGLTRQVGWTAILALALFPLSILASASDYAERTTASHVLAVVVHGFTTWAFIYLFIGCALRFFDRESPWTLYTSQSSYWVFLLHLPVVCFVAWWLVPYDLPAIVKFLVVGGVTTLVCFATYHYWVQGSWVSEFLNGKRFDLDWPWRSRPTGATAATQ